MLAELKEQMPHLEMGPPIEIERAPEVLDWYDDHDPDFGTTHVVHKLASKALKPDVHYDEQDGQSSGQIIQRHLENGGVIAWLPDHSAIVDPVELAAVARQERALNLLMGNTKIASKPGNFKLKPIRRIIDSFGAFPVFRTEDKEYVPDTAHEGEVTTPKKRALTRTEKLIRSTLTKGHNLVWYIEGTRGTHKPKTKRERVGYIIGKLLGKPDQHHRDYSSILPIRRTLARALAGMNQEQLDNVLCVPTSVYYGTERRLKDFLDPVMFIGMPFKSTKDKDLNKEQQTEALQHCRTRAIDIYGKRREQRSLDKLRKN